ncbi:MAG: hypothetical protein RR620_11170 [Clostridium sp.]
MFVIFGILGVILVCIVETLFGIKSDSGLLTTTIFRFIPVGAIAYGIFIGWMVATGVKVSNKEPKKKRYSICACILALITFFGMGFIEYKTTYVNDNYEINRNFEGIPISEYVYTDNTGNDIKMNFINYTKYVLDNSTIIVHSKNSSNDREVDTSGTQNYIRYLLAMAGIALASLFSTIGTLANEKYCSNCGKFLKKKYLFKFSGNDFDEEVEEFKDKLNTRIGLEEYLRRKRKVSGMTYYIIELRYCNECKIGEILFRKMVAGNKESELIEDATIEIDSLTVNDILTGIKK